jgi:demethylmenaquinone methyltransferase/2-methoxy-6-polyprenyl-1,4-benzoquinol methylase
VALDARSVSSPWLAADVMDLECEFVSSDTTVGDLWSRASRNDAPAYVVGTPAALTGVVSRERLARAVDAGILSEPVASLVDARLVHGHPDHPAEVVLQRLARSHGVLPIVGRESARRLLGVVTNDHLWRFMRRQDGPAPSPSTAAGRLAGSGIMDDLDLETGITRRYYDRISRVYDLLADASEQEIRDYGIQALALSTGERVLEVGFGTGHALVAMARAVGPTGLVSGVDISAGMAAMARQRLERDACHVALAIGDARALCFSAHRFDAIFFSFTLERFGAEISQVLSEARRVLRLGGRVGVVAMDDTLAPGPGSSIYHWLHQHFPHAVDCAPIDVVGVIEGAGFTVETIRPARIWTLPVKAVVARMAAASHVD